MPPVLDDGYGESIEQKLQSLALKASPQMQKEIDDILNSLSGKYLQPLFFDTNVESTLTHSLTPDVISTRCSQLGILQDAQDGMDSEEEAKMWSCFATVYLHEVEAYKVRKGRPASMNRKRQIFADILMWAEMLKPGYDQQTAAFMTGHHVEDESFVRVGKLLSEAKRSKGITKL